MLDATRGERWTLDEFQLWECRSPQLSLRYYFTEPPRGVPTWWKPTAGTFWSRSIGKTFSLRWPFTRLVSEACLCCVAAVAKDSRVSQTSSILGYFQRISFLGYVEKPLLKTHIMQLKNLWPGQLSLHRWRKRREETQIFTPTWEHRVIMMPHDLPVCGSTHWTALQKKRFQKNLPVRRFLLRKNLIQENRRDLYGFAVRRKDSGFNSVVKKQQSHHFPYNCPAARVCFMCRFTVCCHYKADVRLCWSVRRCLDTVSWQFAVSLWSLSFHQQSRSGTIFYSYFGG